MSEVVYPYHYGYPAVDVTFARADTSGMLVRRLLVDSGFTGHSAFVLSLTDEAILAQRRALASHVAGALTGRQQRVWVTALLPVLQLRTSQMAICADLSSLSLPQGINGLAGLRFLNQFTRWGGQRQRDGLWAFLLARE